MVCARVAKVQGGVVVGRAMHSLQAERFSGARERFVRRAGGIDLMPVERAEIILLLRALNDRRLQGLKIESTVRFPG